MSTDNYRKQPADAWLLLREGVSQTAPVRLLAYGLTSSPPSLH